MSQDCKHTHIQKSKQIYAIENWGEQYFDINPQGRVCVHPLRDNRQPGVDLYEIVQTIQKSGLPLPILIRFTDILTDRIKQLQRAFKQACQHYTYSGDHTVVYPIKVNQQATVVDAILNSDAPHVGLEAGSKPELLATLALSGDNLIICNGYKDQAYIRLALIGQKLGMDLWLVIEKLSELELILEQATILNIKPQLGVRIRLSSINSGKWQNSGGEKSKFGLLAADLLTVLERLKQANLLDHLQLMHFHMGSQVTDISDIQTALQEACRYFAELNRLGAAIHTVDIGGGLAIDYQGSRSSNSYSMNYSMEEYARNIVRALHEICTEQQLPHPHIITESGRAISAHHAVLISDVIDCESITIDAPIVPKNSNDQSLLELYHNTQHQLQQARVQYQQGKLTLNDLAHSELQAYNAYQAVQSGLNTAPHEQAEIIDALNERLADKLFCNFSMFQSMPDIWGIQQVFPIMPIHNLDRMIHRRAVIQDLTCDSDGRIDAYIDHQTIKKTLPIPDYTPEQPFLIGFFLLGAYQEILGDMHNLFGDTHSVNIRADEKGEYQITEMIPGDQTSDLLRYVHMDPDRLHTAFKTKLATSKLQTEQQHQFEQAFKTGLNDYTYLKSKQ